MPVLSSVLRLLHRLHRQLEDVHGRLERGPLQLRARQAGVAKLQESLTAAQGEVKAARVASDQKQLALKTSEEKIQGLQVKLNQAASNREYQALKDQIAADRMAGSVLQDEILELMEKLDTLKSAVAEAEAALAKGRGELEKQQQAVREQQSMLGDEIKRLETELRAAEIDLPQDLKADYARAIKSRGADGLAPIDGDSCGGCYQHITPNMLSDLKLERVVFCKTCGRLLYLPEDRSPGC